MTGELADKNSPWASTLRKNNYYSIITRSWHFCCSLLHLWYACHAIKLGMCPTPHSVHIHQSMMSAFDHCTSPCQSKLKNIIKYCLFCSTKIPASIQIPNAKERNIFKSKTFRTGQTFHGSGELSLHFHTDFGLRSQQISLPNLGYSVIHLCAQYLLRTGTTFWKMEFAFGWYHFSESIHDSANFLPWRKNIIQARLSDENVLNKCQTSSEALVQSNRFKYLRQLHTNKQAQLKMRSSPVGIWDSLLDLSRSFFSIETAPTDPGLKEVLARFGEVDFLLEVMAVAVEVGRASCRWSKTDVCCNRCI